MEIPVKKVDAIDNPETLSKVGRLAGLMVNKDGKPDWKGISKHLEMIENINLTPNEIEKIYTGLIYRRNEIINADEKIKSEIQEQVAEMPKLLREIMNQTRSMLEGAKYAKDKYNAMYRLEQQITVLTKLLSTFKDEGKVEQTNNLHMTQIVINSLDTLQKQGYIRILKPLPKQAKVV